MCGHKEWWGRDAVNYISLLICTNTRAQTHTHTHFIRLKFTAEAHTIPQSINRCEEKEVDTNSCFAQRTGMNVRGVNNHKTL